MHLVAHDCDNKLGKPVTDSQMQPLHPTSLSPILITSLLPLVMTQKHSL